MPRAERRNLTFSEALREATEQCLSSDPRVVVLGEGVPDYKAVFGTTLGLREQFGSRRVLDMPLAENGMTGIAMGASLLGIKPVLVHQRIDFALLSMDQLINNAAKWHFLFGEKANVPFTIRALVGRGWGQGPQHSQSFHAMFAHVPGLKVVLPSNPYDAKGMLIAAVRDPNPVILLEHRWLYGFKSEVPRKMYEVPLDKARCARAGRHCTIAAFSLMTVEALRAAEALAEIGVEIEVIDLRCANPLDTAPVARSIRKTGYLVLADIASKTAGLLAEISSRMVESDFKALRKPPVRIALPDHPLPTTRGIADLCYPEAVDLAMACAKLLDIKSSRVLRRLRQRLLRPKPLDVPSFDFKGPF